MSVEHHGVSVICERCGSRFLTGRHTVGGARGDAFRKGWTVATAGGGRPSGDPRRTDDICPLHDPLAPPEENMLPYES